MKWVHIVLIGLLIVGGVYVAVQVREMFGLRRSIDVLRGERDGFRTTVQRQRERNLELETTLAEFEAQLKERRLADQRNLDRIAELTASLGQSREYIRRLETRAGAADSSIRAAVTDAEGIEAIITAIERRATGGATATP